MKWFWTAIAVSQIALLTSYAVWTGPIASRVAWLALVVATFDLSIAAWINGVRAFRTSKHTSPWLSFLASIAVFVAACALLAIFVAFSIP